MFSDYSIFRVQQNLDIKCFVNKIFNGLYIDNCIELYKRISNEIFVIKFLKRYNVIINEIGKATKS